MIPKILASYYEPDEDGHTPPESLYGSVKMWAHRNRQDIVVIKCTVKCPRRHQHIDWAVIFPVALTAIAGSLARKSLPDRLPQTTLTRVLAEPVLAIAAYMTLAVL